ncbi:MAG: DUF3368 domain-containing protein [Anaerolineae bacterium]|nr:DUF3368 domain-containing protein [Anaerolineae bacterium]
MVKAISNTSPLLYLYRIGAIHWLPYLFSEVLIPKAVQIELQIGRDKGYDVPNISNYAWLTIINPKFMPYEWLALELGNGEVAAMSLAMEHSGCIVLLDDMLARRTANLAGLHVWGTLKVLLEVKSRGLIHSIKPYVQELNKAGMWISGDVKLRILTLAGEI